VLRRQSAGLDWKIGSVLAGQITRGVLYEPESYLVAGDH